MPSKKRKKTSIWSYKPSPFAPLEFQRSASLGQSFIGLFEIVKSGFRPGPDDPKAWYDRAIRGLEGAPILLVLLGGLILNIVEFVKVHTR